MSTREQIQQSALTALRIHSFYGILEIAPRVGKTKIGIDIIKHYVNKIDKDAKVLVTAPYNPILEAWEKEAVKWNLDPKHIKLINQRSLQHENFDDYSFVICDEIHTLSEAQIEILKKAENITGLTGSISDATKRTLKNSLALEVKFSYDIEDAIADGIISNFEIHCIGVELDNTKKTIMSGFKGKEKLVTEKEHYKFLTDKFDYFKARRLEMPKLNAAGKRADFIYSSRTKIEAAAELSYQLRADDIRHLIFTARTSIADEFGYSYHSKSYYDNLQRFIDGDGEADKQIHYLAVCDMVNMGITFPNLKIGIFHQLKSSEESAIQKVLRMCNLEGDEVAQIYIFYYKNTVDEDWVKKALQPFSEDKITWK